MLCNVAAFCLHAFIAILYDLVGKIPELNLGDEGNKQSKYFFSKQDDKNFKHEKEN